MKAELLVVASLIALTADSSASHLPLPHMSGGMQLAKRASTELLTGHR